MIPLSLADPEAPAALYLVRQLELGALKIGVTGAGRMDAFEVDGWEVVRVWRFSCGYDAMEVEERAIDRWRNVFSAEAALSADQLSGGHTETTRFSPTVQRDIVEFVGQCHVEMTIDLELAADRTWEADFGEDDEWDGL